MAGTGEKTKLYWFNWPSHVGGADTKFVHLLSLLHSEFRITVVPNEAHSLEQREWRDYLARLGIPAVLMQDLPARVDGWAVSLCNAAFLNKGMAREMKNRGAKVAWSNEMMWHFDGEADAVSSGLIDRVMYVSASQRAAIEPGYRRAAGAEPAGFDSASLQGEIPRRHAAPLPWVTTGNWIDPDAFPCRPHGTPPGRPFTVGRLSRPDPDKFPDNFPKFYERLGLDDPVRFRIMGWSPALTERWSEHEFDSRWELLPPAAWSVPDFLGSLDIFVYDLSPRFRESWGRAVVEAMLCGAVPLVPAGGGHHLENLVKHGESGFLCHSQQEFGHWARLLQRDPALLTRMSNAAREDACIRQCDAESHLRLWRSVFA